MIRTDNNGAIFMADDVRTRYIDTTYHFIRDHVEGSFIKIVFVKSDNNYSDLSTKNINKDDHKKHVVKSLGNIDG
jgi:hypothetical protein